jgi:hypothetical protein
MPPRPSEAPAAERPIRTAGSGPTIAVVLLAAAVFGTGFAEPTLVENSTPVDLAIAGLALVMLVHALAGASRVAATARRLALPMVLILVGSLMGAFRVGLTSWIVGDLVRDVGVVLAFFSTIDVARREGRSALRAAGWALVAAAVVVSLHLIFFDEALRARATFPNPNVAGHFLATAIIGVHALPVRRGARHAMTLVALTALVRTSSFGALLQVLVGLVVLVTRGWRAAVRGRPQLQVLSTAGLAAAFIAAVLLVPQVLPEDTEGSALSSSRLERSAAGRFDLWSEGLDILGDNPFGVGAGTTNGLHLLEGEQELHNEPLAYLVERGPLGLIGFLLLAVALWRLAPRGGVGRALLLGFGLSSLVRETSHYRHLWIVLALAIVADERNRAREPAGAR